MVHSSDLVTALLSGQCLGSRAARRTASRSPGRFRASRHGPKPGFWYDLVVRHSGSRVRFRDRLFVWG